MEIVIAIDTSAGRQRFGVLVDSLKDLAPVLKQFDEFKRGKIAELFETEGHGKWPARSEQAENAGWKRATAAAERAPRTLLKKLTREYGRALWRAKGGRTNAVARRAFVLREFERQVESGAALDVAGFTDADRRLQKSVRGLDARLQRAYGRAQAKGRTLGGIAPTIRSVIKGGVLVIDSSWDSPAVAALNNGATVGHGAQLPPRPFLEWEPSDVEYLAVLFRARAMLAWQA